MSINGHVTRLTLALSFASLAVMVMPAMGATKGVLLSDSQAKRAGLRSVWSAHIALDSTRGKITQIKQYIAPKKYWVSFEVAFNNQVDVFSERDRDSYGNVIGIIGAKDRARKHHAQMIDFGYEATIEPKYHEIDPEVFIYALTSTSNVHCLNGETGETLWTTQVGSRDFPSWIGAGHNYVAVLNGSNVYVLNGSTGKILFKRSMRGVPAGSPVLTEDYVFIPSVSGMIEEFSLWNPDAFPAAVRSPGRILVSPVATPKSVAWLTEKGHLNVAIGTRISSLQRGIRFRLRTEEKVESAPTYLEVMEGKRPHNYILFATRPGAVYSIDEDNGGIMWTFRAGEQILDSPVAIGEQVYCVTENDRLFSLGYKNGQEQWQASGVKRVISSSKTRLYVIDSRNRLAALDRNTGSRIATLPTQSLDFQMVNRKTDRIIIGDKSGQIQCLHEEQNVTPVFHRMVKEEGKPKIRVGGQDKKEPGDGGGTETDPFAGEGDPFAGGGDPFGAGVDAMEEEKDPFGGGTTEEEKDPFGGGEPDMKKDDEDKKDPFDF